MENNDLYEIKVYVSKEDLESAGLDARTVTDEQMKELAYKMERHFNSSEDYWCALKTIATECLDIPKKQSKEEVKEMYDKYMKKYGCEPDYAYCSMMYLDDKTTTEGTIKLYDSYNEEEDDNVFYYCSGVNDLLSLMDKGCEDFIVIHVDEFLPVD